MKQRLSIFFNSRPAAYFILPLALSFVVFLSLALLLEPIISPVSAALSFIGNDYIKSDSYEDLYEDSNKQTVGTVKASAVTFPRFGDRYGKLYIENTRVEADLFFGDDKAILKRGAGQYIGSMFPGMGGTVLVCAHCTRHFKYLRDAKVGGTVVVNTNYGEYRYKITWVGIKEITDGSFYDLDRTDENIVLYTCYPFETVGYKRNRFVVYADLISGPKILINE